MKYQHNRNHNARRRKWRRMHLGMLLVIGAAVLAATVAGYVFWSESQKASIPQAGTVQELGRYDGEIQQTVENEVFYFKSSKQWTLEPEESSIPNVYVFTGGTGKLIQHRLTVYIDSVPTSTHLKVKRVLPVTVEGTRLVPLDVSPDCSSAPTTMIENFQGLSFSCDSEGSTQTVAVGEVGGDYALSLQNTAGQHTVVGIEFTDLTANFNQNALTDVVKSFRLK